MAQRLALGVAPGTGWRAAEIRSIAQEAEAAGFETIFAGEVNTDALATAQLMGEGLTFVEAASAAVAGPLSDDPRVNEGLIALIESYDA